jgi:putative transposase
VTSSTYGKQGLLQRHTMAELLIDTLFHYRNAGDYRLHAFVVMRDHFHALLTIDGLGSVERVVQKIKGGFSFRAKRELDFKGEIWNRGFTDERVRNAEQFCVVRDYIHNNPVARKLVVTPEEYPFSSANPKYRKAGG